MHRRLYSNFRKLNLILTLTPYRGTSVTFQITILTSNFSGYKVSKGNKGHLESWLGLKASSHILNAPYIPPSGPYRFLFSICKFS